MTTDADGAWCPNDTYRYNDRSVRESPDLIEAAIEFLESYCGDFEFLTNMQRLLAARRIPSITQLRGVLNCMRGDVVGYDMLPKDGNGRLVHLTDDDPRGGNRYPGDVHSRTEQQIKITRSRIGPGGLSDVTNRKVVIIPRQSFHGEYLVSPSEMSVAHLLVPSESDTADVRIIKPNQSDRYNSPKTLASSLRYYTDVAVGGPCWKFFPRAVCQPLSDNFRVSKTTNGKPVCRRCSLLIKKWSSE